jgi:hypothetical protein
MVVKRALPKDVLAGLERFAARASNGLRRHEAPVVLAAKSMPGNHLRDTGGDGARVLEVPKILLRASGGPVQRAPCGQPCPHGWSAVLTCDSASSAYAPPL